MSDGQVRLLRRKRLEGKTQEAATAAAWMSAWTAREWERGALPSEWKPPWIWRTRPDAFEGVWESDSYEPKRFFSHYQDQDLLDVVVEHFDLHSFRCDPHGWDGLHFQSLILRKPTPAVNRV